MSEAVPQPACFEQALAELEQVVRRLEDGETSLEEALTHYEKGVGLLNLCYRQLREAELRIEKVTGQTPDGQPLTERFEHAATLELKRPDGAKLSLGRKTTD
jgi:exodeoxyribonuclease VII small subunit